MGWLWRGRILNSVFDFRYKISLFLNDNDFNLKFWFKDENRVKQRVCVCVSSNKANKGFLRFFLTSCLCVRHFFRLKQWIRMVLWKLKCLGSCPVSKQKCKLRVNFILDNKFWRIWRWKRWITSSWFDYILKEEFQTFSQRKIDVTEIKKQRRRIIIKIRKKRRGWWSFCLTIKSIT